MKNSFLSDQIFLPQLFHLGNKTSQVDTLYSRGSNEKHPVEGGDGLSYLQRLSQPATRVFCRLPADLPLNRETRWLCNHLHGFVPSYGLQASPSHPCPRHCSQVQRIRVFISYRSCVEGRAPGFRSASLAERTLYPASLATCSLSSEKERETCWVSALKVFPLPCRTERRRRSHTEQGGGQPGAKGALHAADYVSHLTSLP